MNKQWATLGPRPIVFWSPLLTVLPSAQTLLAEVRALVWKMLGPNQNCRYLTSASLHKQSEYDNVVLFFSCKTKIQNIYHPVADSAPKITKPVTQKALGSAVSQNMQMSEASIQQNAPWQKIKAGWVGNADKWCEFVLVLLIHSGEKCGWSVLVWYVFFWWWKKKIEAWSQNFLFRNFLWNYPLESGRKARLKLNETISEQGNNFVQYEMKSFHCTLLWYWELSLF